MSRILKSGTGEGFDHPRSKLFWTFIEIFNEIKEQQNNPDIPFFFENVVMHDKWSDIISASLGQREESYDSIHYSPVARDRFYWTNLNPPRAIIEKYKQEGGWKTYQDILITKTPSYSRVVYKPLFENVKDSKNQKNKIFWAAQRPTTLKLGTLYQQKSQGKSFYRINGKMPTFTAKGMSVNAGLGSYAFPKAYWAEKKESKIFDSYKKLKLNKKPVLSFYLPLNIQKRWNLPKGEYIVFYPEYDEALQAMGFPPTYFSGFKMSTMERSKAEQLGKRL